MKKSRRIALTLIASVCIATLGCSKEQKTKRDLYSSRDDCAKDWGSSECEPNTTGGSFYGPHYFYHGTSPMYFPRGSETAIATTPVQGVHNLTPGVHSPNAFSAIAASRTVRGGFGHSSSSHGGGS
jgi:hypothetical protein